MLKKTLRLFIPIRIRFALKSSVLWDLPTFFTELKSTKEVFHGNSLEDQYLSELFTDTHGTYIDIGSGRPIKGSNTYFFYKRGWNGILVDPLTSNRRFSRVLRRRDQFIQGVISNVSVDLLDFYEFLPYGNSTTVKEIADRQLNTPGFHLVRKNKVQNINIKNFPSLNFIIPTILSIDTEGRDFEIIKGLDFKHFRPKVIVLEAWTHESFEEIVRYLQSKNYVFKIRCGDSVIFQDHDVI